MALASVQWYKQASELIIVVNLVTCYNEDTCYMPWEPGDESNSYSDVTTAVFKTSPRRVVN